MENLDRNMQHRVWQRVYDQPSRLTKQQRQSLTECLRRAQSNRKVYETMENHHLYAEAFARMARETEEHIKMLRQILGK